jgi:predicted aspartyl protease
MLVSINLKNESDSALFRVGLRKENQVREIKIEAKVNQDWKCRLVIPKAMQNLLGLPTKVSETVFYGEKKEYDVEMAEALELQIGNRRTTICPFVMSNLEIPVIGSVLLGELNLEIDARQKNLVFLDRKLRI